MTDTLLVDVDTLLFNVYSLLHDVSWVREELREFFNVHSLVDANN